MAREYPETLSTKRLRSPTPGVQNPRLDCKDKSLKSEDLEPDRDPNSYKPYSKGPCTQLNKYFGPENLYRDYSKANVYVLYGLGIYVCQEATSPRTRSLVTRVAGRAKQNDPG